MVHIRNGFYTGSRQMNKGRDDGEGSGSVILEKVNGGLTSWKILRTGEC